VKTAAFTAHFPGFTSSNSSPTAAFPIRSLDTSAATHSTTGRRNMDRNMMLIAPAIFALTFSVSVHASEPPVKVDVSHLQPAVAAEAQEHANDSK